MNSDVPSTTNCGSIATTSVQPSIPARRGAKLQRRRFRRYLLLHFGQRAHQSHQRPASRGHDIEIEVAVFLEETLTEHSRTISYNLPVYNAFGMVEREILKH